MRLSTRSTFPFSGLRALNSRSGPRLGSHLPDRPSGEATRSPWPGLSGRVGGVRTSGAAAVRQDGALSCAEGAVPHGQGFPTALTPPRTPHHCKERPLVAEFHGHSLKVLDFLLKLKICCFSVFCLKFCLQSIYWFVMLHVWYF